MRFAITALMVSGLSPTALAQVGPVDALERDAGLASFDGLTQGALSTLLRGVELELRTFKARDGEQSIGLAYEFKKDVTKPVSSSGGKSIRSLTFSSKGMFAFEARDNPDDLVKTELKASWFGRSGGEISDSDRGAALLKYNTAIAQFSTDYGENVGIDELNKLPGWRALAEEHLGGDGEFPLSGGWTWHGDIGASLESNQRFTSKQWTYGLEAGACYKSSSQAIGWWNLADYPFAAARWILGEEAWKPRGKSFPILTLGVDQVEASENQGRRAVGETEDSFVRVRAELGMTTKLGTIGSENLKVSLNYRWYKELDSSPLIESVGQDEFSYFAAVLRLPKNMSLTYASGRLPLDFQNNDTLMLGFQISK